MPALRRPAGGDGQPLGRPEAPSGGGPPSGRPRTDRALSKYMSRVLRYTCHQEGLPADTEGWVRLEDLCGLFLRCRRDIHRRDILFVVETSFHYGFPRFEVQGQHPDEFIRATMKNETVVWAAGLSAVRRPPPHRHGRADAGSSSAGPPLPPPPAAPSHGPAADDFAIEWVEIPGGQRGQRALQHSANGQVCLGVPPAGWAAGWVELLVERDVTQQVEDGDRYYWHVPTQLRQWERPRPGDADSTRGRRARECIVCMDGTTTHAFMPCGHWCACVHCAAVLHAAGTGCPMCRRGIASVARIYDMEGRDNAGANSSGAAEATDAEQLPILILD